MSEALLWSAVRYALGVVLVNWRPMRAVSLVWVGALTQLLVVALDLLLIFLAAQVLQRASQARTAGMIWSPRKGAVRDGRLLSAA